MTRELRCTAGHVVGVRVCGVHTGLIALRHAGQEVIAYGVVCIRCSCGQTWTPDAPGLPLADLELKAPSLAGRS